MALAVTSHSLGQQAKARLATIRALVALAVTGNSLEQLAKVRVATIRASAALAVIGNSLEQPAEVRAATIRARSVFLAKAIGSAAATSPASTSCPRPMAAC